MGFQEIRKLGFKVMRATVKHSPLIVMVGSTALGGVCVYKAIKAVKPVETVLEDIQSRQGTENEATKQELVVRVGKEVAAPVLFGTLAITGYIVAYCIMNNRIQALSAAVATSTGELYYYKKKFEDEYGKEKADKFFVDGEVVEKAKGKKSEVIQPNNDGMAISGVWFKNSQEHILGDTEYNAKYVQEAEIKMFRILRDRGYLLINDVLDCLDIPRVEYGRYYGWREENFPGLDVREAAVYSDALEQNVWELWITWLKPIRI